MENFEILFTGDFFIGSKHNKQGLISNRLEELFKSADYRVINLEAPVTPANKKNHILKTGPHLQMDAEVVEDNLKKLKPDLLCLANNHLMDYGNIGLHDTIDFCKQMKYRTVGAGYSFDEAKRPLRFEEKGISFSIINIAENEWANTTGGYPGANPLDVIDNSRLIKSESEKYDHVIVIVHGGHEMYQYPSPRMKKTYRYFAECGASMVIAHHPHCVSGNEIHEGVPIYYSLGNFIFTMKVGNPIWYDGLVVKAKFTKDSLEAESVFVQQSQKDFSLDIMSEEEESRISDEIKEINEVILDDDALDKKWSKFVNKNTEMYLQLISPIKNMSGRYIRRALFLLRFHRLPFLRGYSKYLLNLIRCEAHEDITETIIARKIRK